MSEDFPPGGTAATARAVERAAGARAVVLVEGFSDQIAVETLAARRGLDLDAERIAVVPVGGAHAIRNFVARFGDAKLVGLCDAREEPVFRRALDEVFVCHADLEDELIRAHTPAGVEAVVEANGDLVAFRAFQNQPAWRGRPVDGQLRRWMGSADRRKLRYARLLVEALDAEHVPQPLLAVLAAVGSSA